MSRTPETDALREAIDSGGAVEAEMTSLAAKLERERDEARDTISDVLRALGAMEHEGPRLAALRVKEERDQARRELDIQLESIQFHMERKDEFFCDKKDASKTLAECIEEEARIIKAAYFDSSEELRKARAERDFCMGEIERLRKEAATKDALLAEMRAAIRWAADGKGGLI